MAMWETWPRVNRSDLGTWQFDWPNLPSLEHERYGVWDFVDVDDDDDLRWYRVFGPPCWT
eukprot:scaffold31971_cov46-Attheya_sp.AAC.3